MKVVEGRDESEKFKRDEKNEMKIQEKSWQNIPEEKTHIGND